MILQAENSNCQLELFNSKRWPRKPYCTYDLATGLTIRALRSALLRPYIQANPPHLRCWLIFDIDRPGGAFAWDDADLPPPAWAATNPVNGHAHLVWGLTAPVLVDSPDMRQGPLRYLCAVEAAFRSKLQADIGYSGLITKNPCNEQWRVMRGPQPLYDLPELAEYVDLKKHVPKRGKVEEIGIGRNVTIFESLRQYAYRSIRYYKTEIRNFVVWQSHLNNKALERNGELRYPLDGREIWHIAKSVSKWTWQRFDFQASDQRFSQLQANRGAKGGVASGVARTAASEDKRASARLMAATGVTHGAIADELGVSRRTIIRWLGAGV